MVSETDRKLSWSILLLSAIGDLGEGQTMSQLMNQIDNSPHGVIVVWNQLAAIAAKLEQEVDILLVSYEGTAALCRTGDDKTLFDNCHHVIELIDGYVWRIFSLDERFIKRMASQYKDVKFVE